MRKNKLIALIGTLTMAVAGLAAIFNGSNKVEETNAAVAFTVYFQNNRDWGTPKIHTWGGTPSTEWSGNTLKDKVYRINNHDVYKYEFSKAPSGIIFNDGDSQQTNNIENSDLKNGYCYYMGNDRAFGSYDPKPYTITYNGNGNTGGSMSSVNAYGDVAWGLAENAFTKTGYKFIGWSETSTGEVTYADKALVPAGHSTNLNLYAQWKEDTDGWYLVGNFNSWLPDSDYKLSLNGSSTTEYIKHNVSITAGDEFKIAYVSNDTVDWNQAFGWSNLSNGDGSARKHGEFEGSDNIKAKISRDFTIVFKTDSTIELADKIWIAATYSITYKDLGGSTFSGTHESNYPTEHKYGVSTTLDNPTKSDSTFGGYFTTSDCSGNTVTSLNEHSYTDDITLYAKWVKSTYTVTLNPNPGSGGKTSFTNVKVGDALSLQQSELPTYEHHNFLGYFTQSSGGTQVIGADGSNVNVYSNTFGETLYAHWALTPGVYLAGDFNVWDNTGAINMVKNPSEGAPEHEYVAYNIVIAANQEMKAYSENGYLDIHSVSWSHPDYKCEIDITNDNCKVLVGATYNVYFDTDTGKMHIQNVAMPENGRYFVKNSDISKTGLIPTIFVPASEGLSGHDEYKASNVSFTKDDTLEGYYQDNTHTNPQAYTVHMNESVKVWEEEDGKLICPESGVYSLYMIYNSTTDGYDLVSIFKEGEDTAITYAKFFLKEVAKICDLDGHTDPGVFKPVWSPILEAKYNELGITQTNPAGLLLIDADETYENEDLKKFAYMYDYIYGKYHTYFANLDFVGRNPTDLASGSKLISINNVSTSSWIIAMIAIIGVASIGVFFIYRKHKEN